MNTTTRTLTTIACLFLASLARAVTPTSRFEFEGGFVDMADSGSGDGRTWYWHFDSADAFDDASGSLSGTKTTVTRTSESSSETSAGSASAVRSSFSERILPDVAASCESDLWGFDVEIGRDLWRGERLSLSLDLGATLYRGEDAVRAAGRCYEAVAETRRESVAAERYATTRETAVETTATATTVFSDPSLAGQLDDFRNENGSIGAGTPDGYSNPYGGPNPTLTVADGSVTRTTRTKVRTDTTVTTTRDPGSSGSRGSRRDRTVVRRTIDVAAEGDTEMDYRAGLVRGTVELARYTVHAGVGIRF